MKYPFNWKECTFSDVCEINPGKPNKSLYHPDTPVTFLPMSSVSAENGKVVGGELKKFEDCFKGYTAFSNGDLIFAKITPCMENGKSAVVNDLKNGIGFGSTEFHVIRVTKAINVFYLHYFVRQLSFRKKAEHQMRGAVGQKRVPPEFIANYTIPLPPLPEQHRIVAKIEELFSDLDEGIASLKKAKEQLKTYRQSVLKWAFEGKLTEEWRKKNKPEPASELLKRIKEEREKKYKEECAKAKKEGLRPPKKLQELPPVSEEELKELQELPEGWNWVYLAGLGDLDRGKSKHRPRNDPKLFGGNYPFIQTGEVKAAKGRIRGFTTTYSEFGLQQSKLWPAGTLCITIAANIAETAFLEIDACFPDSIVGYKPPSESVESKYIRFFFEGNKSRIERFAPATAQKNINLNTLENLIVPFCTLEEQKMIVQEIESRLSVADNLEKTIDESLSKADALRQSILKQAFEGKLVPQDPNDEPAEKLLERIQKEKTINDTEKPSKAKNKRKAAISA